MTAHPTTTHRLAITIDIDDPDHDVIYTWAALHANHMLDELWHAGITADMIGIQISDPPRHNPSMLTKPNRDHR